MIVSDDTILEALRRSVAAQDADAFEVALGQTMTRGLCPAVFDLLVEALAMHWHTRHEDVALALQDLRDPRAVSVLYAAALTIHEYLAFDDGFSLARKCTWALADIGTREARSRLVDLAGADNPSIAGYAQRRLDRWKAEHPLGSGDPA